MVGNSLYRDTAHNTANIFLFAASVYRVASQFGVFSVVLKHGISQNDPYRSTQNEPKLSSAPTYMKFGTRSN